MPACGYALVEDIRWTIPSTSPITQTADPYVLTVVSTDGLSHHAEVPVIVQNFVEYDGTTWSPSLSFTVSITDPCRTSTITAITVAGMTATLGIETTQAFTEAVDSAGTTYGTTVCGDRLYEIYDISSNELTEVATIVDLGSGNYQIRAYSELEANEGSHNLRLRVTFADYPLADNSNYPKADTNFLLYIKQATCDCSLITWDNPEQLLLTTGLMFDPADTLTFVKSTANEASKSASPAIRACYRNGGSCPTSSTIAVVDDATGTLDAAFMSMTGNTLKVQPTVSSQIGTYNMRVTQTTSIRDPFSWIAGIVTVTCTITEIHVPDAPTVTEYLINSGDLVLTLTPNFLQYPPCDYTLNEMLIWQYNPSPADVQPNMSNQYEITISTEDISKARMQTLTLYNQISY